jgi:hypothetical protein
MPSRLELHHTNVHRFGTSPVCQRTVNLDSDPCFLAGKGMFKRPSRRLIAGTFQAPLRGPFEPAELSATAIPKHVATPLLTISPTSVSLD